MIPSDHFVRFYNEVFKFLDDKSEKDLKDYWLEISRMQRELLVPLFKEKGLAGMKEYWDRIIEEENLDAETKLTPDYFKLTIHHCQSLAKNLDNDAGLMVKYCDHCEGWVRPLMEELGYEMTYDMKSRLEPTCELTVFEKNGAVREKPR